MIRSMFKQAALLATLSLWSLQALAALYGTIGAGGAGSTLVELNPATGAVIQTIGPVGYAVNGMTYDATTGTLYATTSTNDGSFANGLITINMTTGAGTPVGTGAGQLVNVPSANSMGQLYGWTEASDDPVLWNKAAGTVTVIGESGIGTGEQSLAFDNGDVLYFLNYDENLYTINTTTGAATLVGPVSGITTGYAHHGDFNPATNQLYAINQTNDSSTPNPRALYVIDITTQSVVATLPTVDNLHTLAFTGAAAPAPAPTSIPTLSEWGMILLSSLLALGTIITLRHKRQ
jgi:DNA-binding beta-propeller fold protein YncE